MSESMYVGTLGTSLTTQRFTVSLGQELAELICHQSLMTTIWPDGACTFPALSAAIEPSVDASKVLQNTVLCSSNTDK